MLMRNELLKRHAESVIFEVPNTFIHYINSIDKENGIIIEQWYWVLVIEESHEEYHSVSLVQLSCNIAMLIKIFLQRLGEVIIGKAKKEFVAKHGMIIAIHKVLLCHLVEDSTHAPLGGFESGNNAIQLSGERVIAFPVFLALISQIVLHLDLQRTRYESESQAYHRDKAHIPLARLHESLPHTSAESSSQG